MKIFILFYIRLHLKNYTVFKISGRSLLCENAFMKSASCKIVGIAMHNFLFKNFCHSFKYIYTSIASSMYPLFVNFTVIFNNEKILIFCLQMEMCTTILSFFFFSES